MQDFNFNLELLLSHNYLAECQSLQIKRIDLNWSSFGNIQDELLQLLGIGLLEDSVGKLHLFKTLQLAHKVCPRDENRVLKSLILKVLMMYLQNLEVLLLLAWPSCCFKDCSEIFLHLWCSHTWPQIPS